MKRVKSVCRRCHMNSVGLTEEALAAKADGGRAACESIISDYFGDEDSMMCPEKQSESEWIVARYPADWGVPEDCPRMEEHRCGQQ